MSIEAMKQALEALEAVYGESCDAIHALRTAIQQAEAKTDEPVAWLYIEDGEVMFGHPNGYRPPDARPLVFGDTHPAPGVPDGYALVPIDPTPEMLQAALKVATPGALRAAWARMLAAYPAQKGGER